MRMIKKRQLDALGLQETHLHHLEVQKSLCWWLERHGSAARFNLQILPNDKGSTGLNRRATKWEHASSEDPGPQFLLFGLILARSGGDLRFLIGLFRL